MDTVLAIIRKKPLVFLCLSLVYLLLVGFLKWRIRPPVGALWYVSGGLLGIYFLDIAEALFAVNPSPFRSVVFQALFAVVSFFVVTSSSSLLASGLVLSLYLTIVLWQLGEWKITGSLANWYRTMVPAPQAKVQLWIFLAFLAVFLIETLLFIR